MRYRTLLGALTLALFVLPLGSALCAACVPSECPIKVIDEPGESAPAAAHCSSAESSESEQTGSQASLDRMGTSCCCSLEAAPEPESPITLADVGSFDPALQPTGEKAQRTLQTPQRQDEYSHRLLRVPKPIYTLNSAFLI